MDEAKLTAAVERLTEATIALAKINGVTARALVHLLKERTGGRVVTRIGQPSDVPELEAKLAEVRERQAVLTPE